ncbi:MAG: glycosyltransferase family 2 protein [Cytophagales bacterium]|nr:glycosyltransferase family 2 protein [Cytophagales bacterium]
MVSIIIINYNTFQLTKNCIESIYEHTQNISFEIILVDNASTECDPKLFLKEFPNIILVPSPTNLGFAKGNNLGIQRATGDKILLLNSDTLLKNNAIKYANDFLEKNRNVAVVSSSLEYEDGEIQHTCQRFPSIKYSLAELFRVQKILGKDKGGKLLMGSFFNHQEVTFPDWVWGTFFMFPTDLLQKLPEKKLADIFFMYGEDMQWCMEFSKLGYQIGFEPKAQVIHLMGKSGAPKNRMMIDNHKTFMNLYYSSFEQKLIKFINKLL